MTNFRKIALFLVMIMLLCNTIEAFIYRQYPPCLPTCVDPCAAEPLYYDAFVNADFLYWRISEGGFNEDDHIKFKWDPGFRIGTGYQDMCTGWDIKLFWTHFNTRTKHCEEKFKSLWKLNFDVLDVTMGRDCGFFSCFHVRPNGGLRGILTDQKHQRCFHSSSEGWNHRRHNHKQTSWGIGPQLGLDMEWGIGYGFGLYGNVAGCILYEQFSERKHHRWHESHECRHKDKHHHYCWEPVLDTALGLQWYHFFCGDTLILFRLGGEYHRYYDFNQIDDSGDLIFEGVTFSTNILF